MNRIRFIVWQMSPDGVAQLWDVQEFASIKDPLFHKNLEYALVNVGDDITVELPDVETFIPNGGHSRSWFTPVFMGFSQGRRRAVPCVCIDMQTVALCDLAEL